MPLWVSSPGTCPPPPTRIYLSSARTAFRLKVFRWVKFVNAAMDHKLNKPHLGLITTGVGCRPKHEVPQGMSQACIALAFLRCRATPSFATARSRTSASVHPDLDERLDGALPPRELAKLDLTPWLLLLVVSRSRGSITKWRQPPRRWIRVAGSSARCATLAPGVEPDIRAGRGPRVRRKPRQSGVELQRSPTHHLDDPGLERAALDAELARERRPSRPRPSWREFVFFVSSMPRPHPGSGRRGAAW